MTDPKTQDLTRSLALEISKKLELNSEALKAQWNKDKPFRFFVMDNLLDGEFTKQLTQHLPALDNFIFRANLREKKRVGVDFRKNHPSLQSSLYAFQAPEVIKAISDITSLEKLQADPSLYASGISVMGKSDFLNPHLDNSHDGDQDVYRVLNLLFYISPGWEQEFGGNLEVWNRLRTESTEIGCKFNRLIVMETHDYSWHSVNQVRVDQLRCCVSNYFFSPLPARGNKNYRHVTTFAGRPEEPFKRVVLGFDRVARNMLAKIFPGQLKKTRHRLNSDLSEVKEEDN